MCVNKYIFCTVLSVSVWGSYNNIYAQFGRSSFSLCSHEQKYIAQREKITQPALKAFIGNSDLIKTNVRCMPRVAFCFSGGGLRAHALTLGFLCGAQEIGLLDCCSYMAGLSGSSWALAPWVASGESIHDYYKNIKTHICGENFQIFTQELLTDLDALRDRFFAGEKITFFDVYSTILDHLFLLRKHGHFSTLSATHAYLKNQSNLPLPIYTAVEVSHEPYEWMEWTPFEVGLISSGHYVPVSYFGNYLDSKLTVSGKELSLAHCLSIFGAACAVNIGDVTATIVNSLLTHTHMSSTKKMMLSLLARFFAQFFVDTNLILRSDMSTDRFVKRDEIFFDDVDSSDVRLLLGRRRLFEFLVPNFCQNWSDAAHNYQKHLSCADAGVDFNLPFPVLLKPERNIDIIIVYDSSSSIKSAPSLAAAEFYARLHDLPFPHINYKNIEQRMVSIFTDPDPRVPVVVYFPRIKNSSYSSSFDPDMCVRQSYCKTLNFNYTSAQFDELAGLARYSVMQHKEIIQSALLYKYTALSTVV